VTGEKTILAENFEPQCPIPIIRWPNPVPAAPDDSRLRDLYRGCLLWGAVGDALGRPAEGKPRSVIRERFGPKGLSRFITWPGQTGPAGTITDDTQLTMEIAGTVIEGRGTFSPDKFAERLLAWRPHGRGVGSAVSDAVDWLSEGYSWQEAGARVHSAGNGSAMRSAPIGLAHALDADPNVLIRDAILSSLPTHDHLIAISAAVVMAAGVAWCVRESLKGQKRLDRDYFIAFVTSAISTIDTHPVMERKPDGRSITLTERLLELPELLTLDDETALDYMWNGAFVLESLPAALYCFLKSPEDPGQVLLTAVNAGRDADTVASMAGQLAGAWNGADLLERQRPDWWDELEYRSDLIDLADQLAEIAQLVGRR
jgi:ADP-ribosylglycohydrolase